MALSATSYVFLGVLWHLSANRFEMSLATRELVKDACLAGAAVLFFVVSACLTSTGVLRGAWLSATAIAIGAFSLAIIHGVRTSWGVECNQCGGYIWLVIWPLGSGALAFIISIAIGGMVSGAGRARGWLTRRLNGPA